MSEYPRKIKYKDGYKYQLAEDYTFYTGIFPGKHIQDDNFLSLTVDGYLTVKKGYAWDGPSGPTFDTKDSIRGSLGHDALYQLMREGLLDEKYRPRADKLLRIWCTEDGMNALRAELWQEAVEHFAESCAKAGTEREVLTAP